MPDLPSCIIFCAHLRCGWGVVGFKNCILGNHRQFSLRVWWSERGPLQGLGAGIKHCKSSSLIKLLGNRIQQLDVLCKACVLPGLKETWAQQDLRMPLYNSCTFRAHSKCKLKLTVLKQPFITGGDGGLKYLTVPLYTLFKIPSHFLGTPSNSIIS